MRTQKKMINFFNHIFKLNLFISFCASSLYLLYAYKGESNFPISNLIFIFSSVTIGYFFLQNIGKMRNNQFHYHRNLISFLYIFLHFFLFIYFFPALKFTNTLILLLGMLVFLGYEYPLKLSLRKVPLLKPISIGFVWAALIVGINESLSLKTFLDCLFFIALLSLPFDLKDLDYDMAHNTLTLPQVVPQLPKILVILTLIFTCLFFNEDENLFFGVFFPVMAVSVFNHSKLRPWMYYIIFDGLIFLRSFLYFFKN